MTALDKALADRNGAGTPTDARNILIKRLKALDPDKVVKLVESKGLPASTSKWTLEQLREVVVEAETGKAPVQNTEPRSFILVYNTEGGLVSVAPFTDEAWEALEPEEGQEAITVNNADDLAEVPTDVLLAAFNKGKNTKAKKFANPETAREQAYAALSQIVDGEQTRAASAAKKATAKTPKAPKEPAAPKLINKEPKAKDQIKVVGAGTKIAQLIDLLAQEGGTTLEEITSTLSASGKPINARAWLGYDLNTVAGYGVRQDGDRLYIVYPKGMTAPLAHKVKEAPAPKTAKKAAAAPAATEEAEVATSSESTLAQATSDAAAEAVDTKPAAKKAAAKKAPAKKAAKK